MRPFTLVRSNDENNAVTAVSSKAKTQFLAGGTTMVDLMRLNVLQPHTLVDINKLPLTQLKQTGDGVSIGALMSNSDLAAHEIIRERYPILSQALLAGASQQLRNMATVGGNLMQRTRCPYFRDIALPCNKREPGSGCPAIEGYSRMHAIFGGSDQCIAVMPSDMSVALLALNATIHTRSPNEERAHPIRDFFVAPGDNPEKETVLEPGELIVRVELPASNFAKYSHYLKVRDRSSFAFALVSVAACLDIRDGQIRQASIALGGAAVHPWKLEKPEKLLVGKAPSADLFAAAARAAVEEAKPTKHNQFKVELTRRTVERALQIACGGVS